MQQIKFTKMHGIGNDYIYINCFEQKIDDPQTLARRMSPRRTSVGSDGLILICPSDTADAKMRMFNMDGSEGGSADKIRAFAELLRPLTAAEIVFFDERVTTMAAHQILNLTDTRGAKRKSVVDTLSAEIILQNYLDRERAKRGV